jgi:hypothetical protein
MVMSLPKVLRAGILVALMLLSVAECAAASKSSTLPMTFTDLPHYAALNFFDAAVTQMTNDDTALMGCLPDPTPIVLDIGAFAKAMKPCAALLPDYFFYRLRKLHDEFDVRFDVAPKDLLRLQKLFEQKLYQEAGKLYAELVDALPTSL